jgi:hypothetical protein
MMKKVLLYIADRKMNKSGEESENAGCCRLAFWAT